MTTKYVQAPEMTLQSSISDTATEAILTGFVDLSGTPLVQTDFGTLGYGTFEPNTAREEAVAFVVTSNPSGTATLSLTRGLRGKAPYGTGGTAFTHNAGVKFVISNNPDLLNKFTAKDNDEVIAGSWSFPETPTLDTNPVTKGHYDDTAVKLTGAQSVAGVKTFTDSPVVPDADAAGEAINKGQFDAGAVKLTGNQTIAGTKTFSSSPVVPTAVNPTEAVNKSQMEAYIAPLSGDIKASDTAFGTTKLDVAADVPTDPKALTATANRISALAGGGDYGTPSSTNKFLTQQSLSSTSVVAMPTIKTHTSGATWTKPAGLKYAIVEVQSAGANGATDGAGGGGGAYSRKIFAASALGATETVTVGSGGVGSGNTSFGSLLVAPNAVGTTGATASGGDFNVSGESAVSGPGSAGGNSFLGKGGYNRYQASSTATLSGNNGFGFGGGGQGGQPASDGTPSGGAGGTGAPGIVIVTEYYA